MTESMKTMIKAWLRDSGMPSKFPVSNEISMYHRAWDYALGLTFGLPEELILSYERQSVPIMPMTFPEVHITQLVKEYGQRHPDLLDVPHYVCNWLSSKDVTQTPVSAGSPFYGVFVQQAKIAIRNQQVNLEDDLSEQSVENQAALKKSVEGQLQVAREMLGLNYSTAE